MMLACTEAFREGVCLAAYTYVRAKTFALRVLLSNYVQWQVDHVLALMEV